jgi:hypothetical protein
VALVLSLSTGHVSPQFHLKFDDFFETVQDTKTLPQSKWQLLSHFVSATGEALRPQGAKPASSSERRTPPVVRQEPWVVDFREEEEPDSVDDSHEESTPVPGTYEGEAIPNEPPDHPESTRRSSRQSVPASRLIETACAVLDDLEAVEDYETQTQAEDPIAFVSSESDPDVLHCGEAMKAADVKEFKQAMLQEVDAHTNKGHWEAWAEVAVPSGQQIIPAVWAFKRKRRVDAREIFKCKARINAHGGKQTHGVNYWETHSPVANWFSIRLCLIVALLFNWKTRQIDFALAFPQADAECNLFMELPRGVTFPGIHRSTHYFKLVKNLHGTKQAGRVWNQHLVDGLAGKLKFKQSEVDERVFCQGTTVLLVNIDDGILCGPSGTEIRTMLVELATLFDTTDEGEIDTCLGAKMARPTPDTVELTQPHLTQQILDDMGMEANAKTKDKAAPSSTILRRDFKGEPHSQD